jgi:hypothetical protein
MTLFAKIQNWTWQPTSDLSIWIDRGIILAVILSCGVALSLNVADPDLWGHVACRRTGVWEVTRIMAEAPCTSGLG